MKKILLATAGILRYWHRLLLLPRTSSGVRRCRKSAPVYTPAYNWTGSLRRHQRRRRLGQF